MSPTSFLRACAILSVLAASSCTATSSVSPEGCLQHVQVGVTTETTPLIYWAPACGISFLSVVTEPSRLGGNVQTIWSFHLPEQQPIGPGVRYGRAPAGAVVSIGPQPLTAGVTYRVRVIHTVGGDGLLGSGETIFTR